jgi:hypothetical protein
MPLSRLFRKSSQPSLALTGSADGRRNAEHSDDSESLQRMTEPKLTSRFWRKTASSVNRSTSPPPMSTLPLTPSSKSPAHGVGVLEQPLLMPHSTAPDIFVTNLALVPNSETVPTTSPVPDTLAETWDMVKDGPKDSARSLTLNAVGKPES